MAMLYEVRDHTRLEMPLVILPSYWVKSCIKLDEMV